MAGYVLKRFLIPLCAMLPPCFALAQAPADRAQVSPDEPSVGLVLSGGGARGGAHIGVLRALEELRVPVHAIAGTSIGAAVGGIYASGASVPEIEAFVEGIDWQSAFLNATPRRLRSFRRKRDDDLFLVDYLPGWNSGEIELPTGVVQGQVIDTIMTRVTLPVAAVSNFDELAIPFRAVAADIASGEAVVLGSGDLGRAIRASMSVPAALAPIEINDRLLVDGGIAMNLPVEVAREMGADAVIAVDITDVLSGREELRSILDVTGQLTVMLTRGQVEEQKALLGERDVLIEPSFDDEFSPVTFERMAETIESGYRAVMDNREQFEHLRLDEGAYRAYRASLGDPRRAELPVIDFVSLDNDSRLADSIIETRLEGIELGEPLDVDTLEDALNRVYGLELFQNVRYDLIERDGMTGLEIEVDQRAWGPNYLQLGLQFSSSSDVDAIFGLAASYLRTAINPRGGEWRATFVVGDEPGFLASLYQPIGDRGLYFIEPSLEFQASRFNVFEDDRLRAEVRTREGTFELAGGRELLTWGEWRVGLRTGFGESELRVGTADMRPADDFRRGELFARFSADTLDSIEFPRSGLLASVEWRGSRERALDADEDFDQLLIEAAYAKTWGRHTLLTTLRHDATISGRAPVNRSFRFGGFFDLSGLSQNQLFGQHVSRLGLSYYRRIGDLSLFPAFAGVNLEIGDVWQNRDDVSLSGARIGASLWAGVDTPIGPVYVGYGRDDRSADAFYVFLGRAF